MVQVLGEVMHVVDGGLDGKHWSLSVGIGALSLPVQQVTILYITSWKKDMTELTK